MRDWRQHRGGQGERHRQDRARRVDAVRPAVCDLSEGLGAHARGERERHHLAGHVLGAAHLDRRHGDEVREGDGDHGSAGARCEHRESHHSTCGNRHGERLGQDGEREGGDRHRESPHGQRPRDPPTDERAEQSGCSHETICKAVRRGAEPQYGPRHVREADLRIPRHQEVERGADQHQMQHMRTFAGEETSGRAQVVDRGDAAGVAAVGSAEPDETLHDGGRTEPHDRDSHHGHRTNRRVQHAAEHGGNERARLVHYVHHGHRATHHILAMGAEHLRQRRLHRRRLHRVKHGEHHLHHGYRRQIETGGRKDRRADEHRHGGKRVKRHHDGPTVRTIRHYAAKGREQNRGQDACSKNGGERRRRAGLVKHPHGHGKPQHKVGEERYAETRDEQAEVACAKRISGLASLWLGRAFVCVRHRGFLSCDWPRPFIQTDRRSVIVITIRPRKKARKRFGICDVRMCKMRRTRARLLCGRCILFRSQGREPFGRPQDERLVEHWHADGVEHRGEAADAVFHAGMIGGVEAGHEPVVAEEREQLRRLLGVCRGNGAVLHAHIDERAEGLRQPRRPEAHVRRKERRILEQRQLGTD